MQRKKVKTKIQIPQKNNSKKKIGVVVSSYNSDITFAMKDGAVETLKESGVQEKNIFIFEAPGAFEIPIICQRVIKKYKLDGVVAIGCVIKGDTDHYHFISDSATSGIMDVMLKLNVPIANAILTVNSLEQAVIRSKGDMNKGVEASGALLSVILSKYKI